MIAKELLAHLRAAWHRPEWLSPQRLPKVRRATLGAVCGVGLAAAAWYGLPASIGWVKSHPYFALATIELGGNRRLDRHEILQWAGVSKGMSIWNVAPSRIEARLESHPWIADATVQREFPSHLAIDVQERRPVAIVRLDTFKYVDRTGHILGPLHDDDSWDFPLITGLEDEQVEGFTAVGIHRALQLLRWCKRLSCFDAVSEVHVDRHRGVTVFPLRTAVAVVLGWGSWREKLARSARVFAAWEGQVGRLAAVDVSFRNMVVVKLHAEHHPAAVRSSQRGTRV